MAGDLLNVNPHVHAIVSRGGWAAGGSWVPVAFIDNDAAGCLFRAKVLSFLTGEGLLSDERARVLLGWNHNSGHQGFRCLIGGDYPVKPHHRCDLPPQGLRPW